MKMRSFLFFNSLTMVALLYAFPYFVLDSESRQVMGQDKEQISLLDRIERLEAQHDEISELSVPIGGIIPWWGDPKKIPKRFELCDGTQSASGAIIDKKPDLRDRFLKGVGPEEEALGNQGGANKTTHIHTGTTEGASGANHNGPSQGARMPYHNGQVLPHPNHVHTFATGGNNDAAPYNNAPAFTSIYFIIRTR